MILTRVYEEIHIDRYVISLMVLYGTQPFIYSSFTVIPLASVPDVANHLCDWTLRHYMMCLGKMRENVWKIGVVTS